MRDRQFWLALAVAPLAWLVGVWWLQPDTNWAWPLQQPRALLYLVFIYPIVEELVFRGLFQGALLRRPALRVKLVGLTRANLLVSVLFTALHFFAHPPLAAVAVFVPSLIFGHFRDRYARLSVPILLHSYFNFGYFWIFSSQTV